MRIIKSFALIILIGIAAVGLSGGSAQAASVSGGTINILFPDTPLDGTVSVIDSTFDILIDPFEACCFDVGAQGPNPDLGFDVFKQDVGDESGGIVTVFFRALFLPRSAGFVSGNGIFIARLSFDCNASPPNGLCDPSPLLDVPFFISGFGGESQPAVVPLPAALPLFGSALAMLGIVGWRRKRRGDA